MRVDDTMGQLIFFGFAAAVAALAGWWALRGYARQASAPPRPLVALAALAAAAAAALALYLGVGSPGRVDEPHAARIQSLRAKPLEQLSPAEAVALLEDRARASPNDPLPLFQIGGIYEQFGELERAGVSYDQALRRASRSAADPTTPEQDRAVLRLAQGAALTAVGRVRVAENAGQVTLEVAELFAAAAQLSPSDPEPWLYQAMAAAQAGEHARAVTLWDATLARSPPDHPIRAMAERMRARALAGEAPRAPPPIAG